MFGVNVSISALPGEDLRSMSMHGAVLDRQGGLNHLNTHKIRHKDKVAEEREAGELMWSKVRNAVRY